MHFPLHLQLAFIAAILSGQSAGFWPFGAVSATNTQYADPGAKRIAVIGMCFVAFHSTASYYSRPKEDGPFLSISVSQMPPSKLLSDVRLLFAMWEVNLRVFTKIGPEIRGSYVDDGLLGAEAMLS